MDGQNSIVKRMAALRENNQKTAPTVDDDALPETEADVWDTLVKKNQGGGSTSKFGEGNKPVKILNRS